MKYAIAFVSVLTGCSGAVDFDLPDEDAPAPAPAPTTTASPTPPVTADAAAPIAQPYIVRAELTFPADGRNFRLYAVCNEGSTTTLDDCGCKSYATVELNDRFMGKDLQDRYQCVCEFTAPTDTSVENLYAIAATRCTP